MWISNQLRLEDIAPDFEPGRIYYHRRLRSWQYNGEERWWEVYIELLGVAKDRNELIVREHRRWNGSDYTALESEFTLTLPEARQLLAELRTANGMDEEQCVTSSIE